MSFTINMDLLNQVRKDTGATVAPITEQIGYTAPTQDIVVDLFADTTQDNELASPFIPTTEIDYSAGTQETPTVSEIAAKYNLKESSAEKLMPLVQAQTDAANTLTSIVAPAQANYWTSPEGQAAQQQAISDITSGKVNVMDEIAWGAGTLDDYGVNAGLKSTLENTAGYDQAWQDTATLSNAVTGSANLLRQAETDKEWSVAGIPFESVMTLVGDLATGGMMSAAKNITQGINEGDLGQVVEGVVGAGISLNAKDIKAMTEAAEAAATSGDWVKAAELSREIDSLKNANAILKTGEALSAGNIGSALLSGAPLVGVDPVGSVTESLFGQDAYFDDLNNYKFGGGFDVSAASEGIVQAGGALLDTGGDVGAALQKGLLTYAREGGSLPDLAGSVGIDWPNVRLNADIPDWLKFNPDFDFEGFALSGMTLPEWLKINGGGLNLGGFNFDINNPFGDINLNNPFEGGDLGDWWRINGGGIDLEGLNNPFGDINLNNPFSGIDINAPDLSLPDVTIDTPQFSSPEFGSLDGSIDLPSLDLSLPDSADLEGIVTSPKWKKTPKINTTATLLQKMTPKQRTDYLDLLLRSMQA